jgi:hypothetical protein
MRRSTLFLLAAVTAGLTAASADAQMFRRRVVYTDPYYGTTWTYPTTSYYSTIPVVNNGVTGTATTPSATTTTVQPVVPATQTTVSGQVVYPATYTTPSTSYYVSPSGYYYYPSSSYYPSSNYWSGYTYPAPRVWYGRWR